MAYGCCACAQFLCRRESLQRLLGAEYRRGRQARGLGHPDVVARGRHSGREATAMTVEASQAVPGPGRWDRDNSHFPLPISRYLWELFAPAYLEGAPRGFARCGSLV